MPSQRPPTIDPVAAESWRRLAPPRAPWLHEEVARRMAERLEWIRLQPAAWAHWGPVRGGLQAHASVASRYPQAAAIAVESLPAHSEAAGLALSPPWWKRWAGTRTRVVQGVDDHSVQMIWSNMALHLVAEPQALIAQWHRALATDGFLMFSCLGPDTLREVRSLYADLGWPPPAPEFTDMHDWGDMLVHAGFAEPVMDMERLTLTWPDARALLTELRELGANVHPGRFAGLRGRGWRMRLESALAERLAGADGRLALTFEIVYGHALKPAPRMPVGAHSALPLDDMRELLRGGRRR